MKYIVENFVPILVVAVMVAVAASAFFGVPIYLAHKMKESCAAVGGVSIRGACIDASVVLTPAPPAFRNP